MIAILLPLLKNVDICWQPGPCQFKYKGAWLIITYLSCRWMIFLRSWAQKIENAFYWEQMLGVFAKKHIRLFCSFHVHKNMKMTYIRSKCWVFLRDDAQRPIKRARFTVKVNQPMRLSSKSKQMLSVLSVDAQQLVYSQFHFVSEDLRTNQIKCWTFLHVDAQQPL